jgi:hypothetical protein
MGDWLKSARDEISRQGEGEISAEEELIATASLLTDLVMRKLTDVNAQLLGNRGTLLDFSQTSIHPADFAFKMIAARHYQGTRFSGINPVVWRLAWSGPSFSSDRAQLAVTLVPPPGADESTWKFAVNVEPVDMSSALYGDGDHTSQDFQGATDEASLNRLLSEACRRGAGLFRV